MDVGKEVVLLIAEDDWGNFQLIERMLHREGVNFPITHFITGSALIGFLYSMTKSRLREKTYVILLDINLPGMDGLEVLERIKKSDVLEHLPVIILTTMDDPITIDFCHKLGCTAYFTKPLKISEFKAVLKKLGISVPVVKDAKTP